MDYKRILPLVEKAMEGDRKAYANLCEAIIRDVLYVCIKITGNPHHGEDAAQETLIQLGTAIKKLRSAEAFPAWLNRLMIGVCGKVMRKEWRQAPTRPQQELEDAMELNQEFLPAEWAESREMRAVVLSALATLPPKQQHVLLMYYFEYMSLKDIAATLKINESTARSNLRHARNTFKKRLEKTTGPLHALAGTPAAPTLAVMFSRDAALLITEESSRRVLAAVLAALAGGGAAAAAGGHIYTLLIGVAPAAAALGLAAAVTFGGSPTPGPVASPPGITPQYSESAPAPAPEQSDLYTPSEQTPSQTQSTPRIVSSGSAQTAGEAGTPRPAQPAERTTVAGRVVFVGTAGAEVPPEDLSLQGVCVGAYGADGRLASFAYTDAGGHYTLSLPGDCAYTLQIVETPKPAFGPQTAAVPLAPGEKAAPDLPLADNAPPSAGILFVGAAGTAHGPVGPAAAQIAYSDALACSVTWQVLSPGAAAPLLEGQGMQVPLGTLPTGEGRLTLSATITDLAGNQTTVERIFYPQES